MNKTSSAIVRTLLLGTSCLSVLAFTPAKADPTGGVVVAGSATITSGANSTVINQKTDKALINWDSFSISAGGTVRFNQPGSGSFTLNRVIGNAPSTIYGSLLANGNVWLINGNGILFGKGSQINVGGLIATTADIADRDFMGGNYSFAGGTGAAVVNQGTIRAKSRGSVVLSGASVSNQGLISADTGTVVLGGASAFTVDFTGDNLLRYQVTAPVTHADNGKPGVSNSGTIATPGGGRVVMTARAAANVTDAVVNNTGMISATSAKVENGEVILDGGDGDVAVGGTIDASGAGSGQTGGNVAVTGRNITVADNATINVSGDAGGGTVRIGGDLHGSGTLPHAANVTVGSATIKADAGRTGNGGTVVVWSDGRTSVAGAISAKGGSRGGDGGLVETSGHRLNVAPTATVDTSAPHGATGTWLLDPDSIVIEDHGDTALNGGVLPLDQDSEDTDTIAPSTIVAALANTNVRLEAASDITVYSDVIYSSSNALSLLAGHDIFVAASVQNSGSGAINVIAGWDGETTDPAHFTDDGVFGNGGNVYITSDDDLDPGDETESHYEPSEVHPVAIGSAHGTTTVAGSDVQVLGYYASSQIGYAGPGGGDIVVRATNDITLDATYGFNAIIGNGDGSALGDVSGNIDVRAADTLSLNDAQSGGLAWIGNRAGDESSETGNVTVVVGSGDGDVDFGQEIAADLVGGDFTLGVTDNDLTAPGLEYDSAHTLSLLSAGNLLVSGTISNSGTGSINLVAGWDGTTLDPAHFGDDGVYGQHNTFLGIGGPDAGGDVSLGSAGGTLNLFGANIEALANSGNVQLGYHGTGGGDINVLATGDIVLSAQDNQNGTYSVMVGNGALDGSVGGQITGNVFLKAQGTLALEVFTGEGCHGCSDEQPPHQSDSALLGIGNSGGSDAPPPTGNVTIVSAGIDDSDNYLPGIVGTDLGYADVTIGHLGTGKPLFVDGQLSYDSVHTLSLLSQGGIELTGKLQNSGSGAINVVAGWDGTTLDAAHFGDDGVYGNEGGSVTVGGEDAQHNASVGSAGGPLNIFAANLTIDAKNGYAQVGYHGAGGGDIFVHATGNIAAYGSDDSACDFAQLGNGDFRGNIDGDVTGNIFLSAGGYTAFNNGDQGTAWLGNVASEGFTETGDVTALTQSGFFRADYVAADLGSTAGTGGNVFIGYTDAEIGSVFVAGLDYSSANSFTFAAAGDLNIRGAVSNAGSGAITLVAGWDGHTIGSAADLKTADAFGIDGAVMRIGSEGQQADISVGSADGLTTLLTGDLTLQPGNGHYAQVGYHGAGGGDIAVDAKGDLTLIGGEGLHEYAMIGNGSLTGDVDGNITGNIDIHVGGTTQLTMAEEGGQAWIGNVAGEGFTESGNVLLTTFNLDSDTSLSDMAVADLGGGDVTLAITDSESDNTVDKPLIYASSHTLTLLSAGSWQLAASIQNSGTGAINIVAGWDGHTYNGAHLFDAGVFGNHNGAIVIGGDGADGDVAVGGMGGTTNLGAKSVTLAADSGYAQLGYHGATGGAINVNALGTVALTGGEVDTAQIGNGTVFGSNAAGGDVSIAAASIVTTSHGGVTANNLKLAAASGDIGAVANGLFIASNTLSVTTAGGNVYLASPSHAVVFAGTGVNLTGGGLTLTAGGIITQTAAVHTGLLSLNAGTSDITLTNSDNGFGSLTVATSGNASFRHTSLLTVASANIGGTLTLTAGTGINQGAGALVAGSLNVSVIGAPSQALQNPTPVNGILLTNSSNSFGTLTVSTNASNDANIVDSTGFVLAGATVGGNLTLAAGGAITQTGALHTNQFAVSTTAGDITLSNAANTFGDLTVTTAGSNNASLANAGGISVASAHVGGTLTLSAANGVNQTGAIVAGGLNVSTANNVILLTNAGNSFAVLGVTTGPGDATVTDSTGVSLTGAHVGGKLTLNAVGAVGQSGAISTANGLSVTTTSGGIALTKIGNAVLGTVALSAPGAASLYNTQDTTTGAIAVGGDLTLLSKGSVTFLSSIQANTGNVTVVAGWDGTTTNAASFGNSGVYGNGTGNITIGGPGTSGAIWIGSKSGTTGLYAANVTILGTNGTAQLGYHGAGGGAILVRAVHDLTLTGATYTAMLGNGSLTNDVSGDVTGDIDVRLGGNAAFNGTTGGAAQAWLGNVAHAGSESGNLVLVMADETGTQDSTLTAFGVAALAGGDVTYGFTGAGDQGPGGAIAYNSNHTLNVMTAGNFVVVGSIQNSGSGAINIVAGWDGHTLTPGSFGTAGVYGNNAKGILIGGANASGNAALGSQGGTTSVYGATLALTATHGYAQLGFNGHGSGAIFVKTTGGVTLTGGAGDGQFAQIGNGGRLANGNNSGDITISAGGDLVLNAGAGAESYVQVGHGGAESNTGANGYSNVAPITVTAANVMLNAGSGAAAYVEIGNGGFKSGVNLAGGTALNGGDITVTAGHAVSLVGNGTDAYAQIGNGGGQSNLNPAASAGGTDSGNIVVHAPNGADGSVILLAGAGDNAYVQIGNGGYAINSGLNATVANWTVTGDVTVTDLDIHGGSVNGYAQVGNGDASHHGYGDISGDIFIFANGHITYESGTGPDSWATIGNYIGQGTTNGEVQGDDPPPPPELKNDPAFTGITNANTATSGAPTHGVNVLNTVVITLPDQDQGGTHTVVTVQPNQTPGPLASLDSKGADSSTPNTADSATVIIADSLDGGKKAGSQSILAGMLRQTTPDTVIHPVPPADQDFSSWGNEALWQ